MRRIFTCDFFLIRIEICFVRLTCQIHMYQVDLTTICHMDNKTGFVVIFFDRRLIYSRDCTYNHFTINISQFFLAKFHELLTLLCLVPPMYYAPRSTDIQFVIDSTKKNFSKSFALKSKVF